MPKTYAVSLPLLLVWLTSWIVLGWGSVLDDSFIHLRYADNLLRFHAITFDGVHADYGASSLLYVCLLAGLRTVSAAAGLPRVISSLVHLVLFAGLAWGFLSRRASLTVPAQTAALTLMLLTVSVGAVRWLDDGMETGLVVSVASLLAWLIRDEYDHIATGSPAGGALRFLSMVLLGFLTVLLRTELAVLCGAGCLLLLWTRMASRRQEDGSQTFLNAAGASCHILLGAALAVGVIFAAMHTLLPDTAMAKSHGVAHWFNSIHDTVVTLAGAMSFGMGLLIFWVLTLALVAIHRRRLPIATIIANSLFPVVLAVASLRGQEIQGVRYFAWTFFFPIIWNVTELRGVGEGVSAGFNGRWLAYSYLAAVLLAMPFEAIAMHHVLTQRAATTRQFEAEHLEALSGARGIASDIGYIGYFTRAKLCDLAGLVNGRGAALLSGRQRAEACVDSDPDFLFVNVSQFRSLNLYRDFSQWQVCGHYEFTNVTTADSHFLIVRPELTSQVCSATGEAPQPSGSVLSEDSNRLAAATLVRKSP